MNSRMRTAALTAGVPVLAVAALAGSAQPASANGPCHGLVKDNPTPIHASPSASSPVVRWKYNGQTVTGNCTATGIITVGGPGPNITYVEVNTDATRNGVGWIDLARLYYYR